MAKTAMALIILTAGMVSLAGQPRQMLTVYVRNTANAPGAIAIQAKALAGEMFAKIGISLEWRTGKPAGESSQMPILIELATGTPENRLPGALAFALPYEGTHVTVFFDRVETRPYVSTVLAHVLVHEITHLLQGIAWHSAVGVMKAQWTGSDYDAMRCEPFGFTPQDVDLIYAGLRSRGQTVTLATLAAAR